uniref:Uncharacterized protein n=1 Tax=Arundo donax TaxID=35708 RepID=A0A0A8YFP8_ARUDO
MHFLLIFKLSLHLKILDIYIISWILRHREARLDLFLYKENMLLIYFAE